MLFESAHQIPFCQESLKETYTYNAKEIKVVQLRTDGTVKRLSLRYKNNLVFIRWICLFILYVIFNQSLSKRVLHKDSFRVIQMEDYNYGYRDRKIA